MQRFGSRNSIASSTSALGLELLKGNFEKAVDLILAPRQNEKEDYQIARKYYAENKDDAKGALKLFPNNCLAEKAILQFFSKTGSTRDYKSAISKVNYNFLYNLVYLILVFV